MVWKTQADTAWISLCLFTGVGDAERFAASDPQKAWAVWLDALVLGVLCTWLNQAQALTES